MTNITKLKQEARDLFSRKKRVYCPFLRDSVVLNSDGLHHLEYSGRRARNKKERALKFVFLKPALKIIEQSGTVQEFRKELLATSNKATDGLRRTKQVSYWGFIALDSQFKNKIKVIVRRIGDGQYCFWSVMPITKNNTTKQFGLNEIFEK